MRVAFVIGASASGKSKFLHNDELDKLKYCKFPHYAVRYLSRKCGKGDVARFDSHLRAFLIANGNVLPASIEWESHLFRIFDIDKSRVNGVPDDIKIQLKFFKQFCAACDEYGKNIVLEGEYVSKSHIFDRFFDMACCVGLVDVYVMVCNTKELVRRVMRDKRRVQDKGNVRKNELAISLKQQQEEAMKCAYSKLNIAHRISFVRSSV